MHNLTFHLAQDSVSSNEFENRLGPLLECERVFFERNKTTVEAHIETVAKRLRRYESYFTIGISEHDSLTQSFSEHLAKESIDYIDMNELKEVNPKQATYAVDIGHTTITVARISPSGVVEESKCTNLIESMQSYQITATELFNCVTLTLRKVICPKVAAQVINSGNKLQVVLSSSFKMTEDGQCFDHLSGGFREKKPSEKIFKNLRSYDPVTGVPIKDLMNYALKAADVPAVCVAVVPTCISIHASTVVDHHDELVDGTTFMSISLSDGVQHSITDFGTNSSTKVRVINFDASAYSIPANNIDQNYNFMHCSSRTANPLTKMISTESIADLTRMTYYHVLQHNAPTACWNSGSLTCEDVLNCVFMPEKCNSVLQKWLKREPASEEVLVFEKIANMVVKRNQHLVSALIAAAAIVSGRCYAAFGSSVALVKASHIDKFPDYLGQIEEMATKATRHGNIKCYLNNQAHLEGASKLGNTQAALAVLKSPHY